MWNGNGVHLAHVCISSIYLSTMEDWLYVHHLFFSDCSIHLSEGVHFWSIEGHLYGVAFGKFYVLLLGFAIRVLPGFFVNKLKQLKCTSSHVLWEGFVWVHGSSFIWPSCPVCLSAKKRMGGASLPGGWVKFCTSYSAAQDAWWILAEFRKRW